jgi:hypothetical protein
MRHFLLAFAQIDPTEALHQTWTNSSPEVHVASAGTGFAAYLSGINWAAVGAFVAVAVPLGFGVIVQCFKQVRIAQIQLREEQIASDDRIAARRADAERARSTSAIIVAPASTTAPAIG